METIIAAVVALAVIVGGACVIYMFVRFGIISARITKGASTRLRHPAPDGIDALTGFPPPTELIDFYRHAPFVELVEYSTSTTPTTGGRSPAFSSSVCSS
jgi:hypothetical protein